MAGEERFGHSLALVDGDIVLDQTPGGGRTLRTIAGRRNLLQALELRVLTPFGSHRFNTGYGLDFEQVFTQPAGVRMAREIIRLNLVRTIGTDPRVRDVREVVFPDDARFLALHPELNPEAVREARKQRRWWVDVIVETVDEQMLTLPLELVV